MQLNSDVYRDGNNPRPGKQHYPAEIEGMSTLLMGKFAVIPYADFSVFALLRAVGVDHDWLGNQAWPAWPIFLAYGVGFVVWLGLTWRRAAEGLLAGIAAWIFLADFFLPAYRNSYNDVLMLDVVAAGIAVAAGVTSAGKIPWGIWPCAAALPVGVLVYLAAPEQVALINLPTALLTVGAVMFVCSRAHKCGED
jgi:Na+/proline symporter